MVGEYYAYTYGACHFYKIHVGTGTANIKYKKLHAVSPKLY